MSLPEDEQPVTRSHFDNSMQSLQDRLTERMRGIETNMLTEFHRYAKGQVHRFYMIDTVNTDSSHG